MIHLGHTASRGSNTCVVNIENKPHYHIAPYGFQYILICKTMSVYDFIQKLLYHPGKSLQFQCFENSQNTRMLGTFYQKTAIWPIINWSYMEKQEIFVCLTVQKCPYVSLRGRPLIIWGEGVVQIFANGFFFRQPCERFMFTFRSEENVENAWKTIV